jgi:CDP-diacylglycerol--glycerol-3-phosphate 3-phosphatidyltransferase
MIGVFIYFFQNEIYLGALITYVAAIASDMLDGYLARRNNWVSNVGKVLDPLADKLMLIAALACFCVKGWLPWFIFIIAAAKEVIMIIGGLVLYKRNIVVYADWFGKIAASCFNIGVVATVCAHFWPWISPWNIVLLCIGLVLAFITLFHYARINVFNQFKRKDESSDEAKELGEEPPTEPKT